MYVMGTVTHVRMACHGTTTVSSAGVRRLGRGCERRTHLAGWGHFDAHAKTEQVYVIPTFHTHRMLH